MYDRFLLLLLFFLIIELERNYPQSTLDTLQGFNEEDIQYDLIEQLVSHIVQYLSEDNITVRGEGGGDRGCCLLIFLPGMMEIITLQDRLKQYNNSNSNRRSKKWLILPLHSSLTPVEQHRVFDRVPRDTVKIVISTNIAETSITIDGK